MNHSGLFVNLGKKIYVAAEIAHIDYCHPDEMLLIDKGGVNDCNDLMLIQNDNDAFNLVNFIDANRMATVFVEHEKNWFDDKNNNESEDRQSICSDSDITEMLVDSECEVSNDDALFDDNIDTKVEWGDINDPKFELYICFGDTATFRQAVKQHSIKQGRDIIFTINDKFKVQTKCKHKTYPWVIYAYKIQNEDTQILNDLLICTRIKFGLTLNGQWIIQKDIKLVFNKSQLYIAKKILFKIDSGSDCEQYAMVWSFCTLKKGFLEGCRLVICFDGCHLKTFAGDVLLSAVEIDSNNCMYLFAYAIVENNYHWTIMSDKQKRLIDAIDTWLPGCEHRFCVMHLYKNFKLTHKGLALKNILWKAAKATRVVDFEITMAYTHSKCYISLNNMSESFNSMILRARCKPIASMLEIIRIILMRRDQMEKYNGDLYPKINKLLELMKKKAMEFIAHWNGHDQFEIKKLTGIPGAHVICELYYMRYTPEDYVDNCYKKETFMKIYSHLMGALDGSDMWPKVDLPPLIPPVYEKLPAKRNNGKKGQVSKQSMRLSKKIVIMTCSKCRKPNHNARGYPYLNKLNLHMRDWMLLLICYLVPIKSKDKGKVAVPTQKSQTQTKTLGVKTKLKMKKKKY
ncbi:hypothetical protein Pfo_003709 [Paulownia fortunei]|nr:hypothetical protein Pfo_003709 [Paulownia fortunei]